MGMCVFLVWFAIRVLFWNVKGMYISCIVNFEVCPQMGNFYYLLLLFLFLLLLATCLEMSICVDGLHCEFWIVSKMGMYLFSFAIRVFFGKLSIVDDPALLILRREWKQCVW